MAHAKSEFISPHFLFDDNFSFRKIKQHITDKGRHKGSWPNDREERKGERDGGVFMEDVGIYLVGWSRHYKKMWLYLCACHPWQGTWLGSEQQSALPSASTAQTADRAPSGVTVTMLVLHRRSKHTVALRSNNQGIYCPHDEWGERIRRTGWREERGWDGKRGSNRRGRRRNERTCWVGAGGGGLKAEWLSIAERKQECKNERWERDGGKRNWRRKRSRGTGLEKRKGRHH